MALCKFSPLFRAIGRRGLVQNAKGQNRQYLWRPSWWDRPEPVSDMISRFERQFRDMEREFDRFWSRPGFGRTPFFDLTPRRAAADLERFHLEQPIVEEEGKKKFKLIFDASHFKPEEIDVKTSGKRFSLSAKHQSKDKGHEVKYEYFREYELPDGVEAEELTCKYTNHGQLVIEAPYSPPPSEKVEQAINVKHEK